jgi:Ca-activated chloride channel family protein
MDTKLETAQEAAIGFARRMRQGDVMEVVDFDSQVNILQPFTGDVAALERAIRQATVNGSTSLYNAIYISLKSLQKVRARKDIELRREAIVVLSDGDDTSSLVAYEEVLDLAKRSETVIYAIGLRQPDQGRRDFKQAEFVLRQLSQETGGRVYYPGSLSDLPKIYEQIAQELASQYSIGYTSKNPLRNGAWRRISVKVLRPELVGRTRQGYFAGGAARAY